MSAFQDATSSVNESDGSYTGDADSWIAAVAADAGAGVPVGVVSARFHRAVAEWTAAACAAAGTEHVVLSGGVFQNRLLLEAVSATLGDAGVRVLIPRRVPPNDGGLRGCERIESK